MQPDAQLMHDSGSIHTVRRVSTAEDYDEYRHLDVKRMLLTATAELSS